MKTQSLIAPAPIESSPLTAQETEPPQPGPGEVLIRVTVCGICHTDLHIIEGELPPKRSPLVPGHQVVGRIESVGSGVDRRRPGDRVGIAWLGTTCGRCEYCRRGDENLCEAATFTGYDTDGGFAEYMTARADFTYPLPENFPDISAAPLLCAGIIGYRAFTQSGIKPGETLALYGFGASAHITIQVARHFGCPVYVLSRSQAHRAFALELGAEWSGTAEEHPPRYADAAISFAPSGSLVPMALASLRPGGTLALAGIYSTPIPSIDYSLLYKERVLRSIANNTRRDAIDFLGLAARIPIHTETEVFPLSDANRALLLLKAGKIRGAGVLTIAH